MERLISELFARAAPGARIDLRSILPIFSPRRLAKGEVFLRPGQDSRQVGFILDGVVRHYLIDGRGRERTTDFCRAGEFTGVLGEPVEGLWLASVGESRLAVAEPEALMAAVASDPELQKAFSAIVLGYFQLKTRREAELLSLDPPARYGRFLANFPGLAEEIPQYLLASYLGIAPETLSRIRSDRR
jgi:CRP-like cAMP-binding protein